VGTLNCVLFANIRLGLKFLRRTNTLAYFSGASVTKERKGFKTLRAVVSAAFKFVQFNKQDLPWARVEAEKYVM
jgi:hypothetical protein